MRHIVIVLQAVLVTTLAQLSPTRSSTATYSATPSVPPAPLTRATVFVESTPGDKIGVTTTAMRRVHDGVTAASLVVPPNAHVPGASIGLVTCFDAAVFQVAVLATPHSNHSLAVYTTGAPSSAATLANVAGCNTESSPEPGVLVYTVTGVWAGARPVTEVVLVGNGGNVSLVVYVNATEWFPVPVAAMVTHGTRAILHGWSCTTLSLKPSVVGDQVLYVPDQVLGKIERYGDGPNGFVEPPSTLVSLYFSGPSGFNLHSRNPPQYYVHANGYNYGVSATRFANETAVRSAGFRMGVSSNASLDAVPAADLGMGISSRWNSLSTGFETNYDADWAPNITQPEYWLTSQCQNPWCDEYSSLAHARCYDPIGRHYRHTTVQIVSQLDYSIGSNVSTKNIVMTTKAGGLANCARTDNGYAPCVNATQIWPPIPLAPVVIPILFTALDLRHVAPVYVQVPRVTVAWTTPIHDGGVYCVRSNVGVTFDPTTRGVGVTGLAVPVFTALDATVLPPVGRNVWGIVAPRAVYFDVDLGVRVNGTVAGTHAATDMLCVNTRFANGTTDRWCLGSGGPYFMGSGEYLCGERDPRGVNAATFLLDLPRRATINYAENDTVALVLTIRAHSFQETSTGMTFPTQDQPPVILTPPRELWPSAVGTPSPSASRTTSTGTSATGSATKSPSFTRTRTTSSTASVTTTVSASGSVTVSTSRTATGSESMSTTASQTYTPSTSVTTTTSPSVSRSASRTLSRSGTQSLSASLTTTRTLSSTRSRTLTPSGTTTVTVSVSRTQSMTASESRSPSTSSTETATASVSASRTITKSLSGTRTPSRTASVTRDWLGAPVEGDTLLTIPVVVMISLVTAVGVGLAIGGALWYQRRTSSTDPPKKDKLVGGST